MQTKYAIVTDFDGTVTTLDIGNSLVTYNGTMGQPAGQRLGANEWMAYHFGRMKMGKEEFESLVLSYAEVRPGFAELAAYCQAQNIPLEIASGGLDIYISPVLKKNNLQRVPVLSVRGKFTPGAIAVDFPHFNGMTLHDFKASRVLYYREQGYKIIFLGDGISDFEAAKLADIVFATDDLEALCKANKVKYYKLTDFNKALQIVKGAAV